MGVAFYHLSFCSWAIPASKAATAAQQSIQPNLFSEPSKYGFLGVPVFFVISGFVIAISAESATATSFFRSRALRLIPAVLICAPVTVAVAVLTGVYSAKHGALVLARCWLFPPYGPWPDGPYWTLPIELSFYWLVLLLLWRKQFSLLPHLAWILASISAAYWAFPPAADLGLHRTFSLLLIHHGCYFAAGIFFYRMRKEIRLQDLAGLLLCLTTGPAGITADTQAIVTDSGEPVSRDAALSIWLAAMAFVAASIGLPSRLISAPAQWRRVARLLGLATYPLYLIHDIVGNTAAGAFVRAGLSSEAAILASMIGLLGGSLLIAGIAEPMVRRSIAGRLPMRSAVLAER